MDTVVLDMMPKQGPFHSPPLAPEWLLLGAPMLIDHHPSQQHASLQHEVIQLHQKVTWSKGSFEPNSPKYLDVDGGVISCQYTKYLGPVRFLEYLQKAMTFFNYSFR